MSNLAITTAPPASNSDSTPLLREAPSLLRRICSCVSRIIPENQHESQNATYHNSLPHSSFLERLREFNVFSVYPCEMDDNTRALLRAEFMQESKNHYISRQYVDLRGG